jgi:hypothetical protein
MSSEIFSLVSHANTLQKVVEDMLLLRGRDEMTVQGFLNRLNDEDYRFLIRLDFGGKLIYLAWRYAL